MLRKFNSNQNKFYEKNKNNNINNRAVNSPNKFNSINNIERAKNNNLNIANFNLTQDFKRDLLKIFINIFYYEENFLNNKNYNNNEKMCLISPYWMEKFKNYYHYQGLLDLLEKNKDISINYKNLEDFIDNIINSCLNIDNILDFKKGKLPTELSVPKAAFYLIRAQYNIHFLDTAYILPFKIMKIIKKWNNTIAAIPATIFFKDINIYYTKINNIIVGKLANNPLFKSNYVFRYNNENILKIEQNILFSHSIEEYIKSRECLLKNFNKQILRNDKGEEIGNLIVLYRNKNQNYNIGMKNNQRKNLESLKRFKTVEKMNNQNNQNLLRGKNIGKVKNLSQKQNNIISNNVINTPSPEDNNESINNRNSPKDKEIINKPINFKELEIKINEIKKLNEEISELKRKNFELNKLKIDNSKIQEQLNKANIIINNYKKREEEFKNHEKILNDLIKKENEFNKKISFLEDKENFLEKENNKMEQKRKEFQKDLEFNEKIKNENDNLLKIKIDLEKEIKEKEIKLQEIEKKIDKDKVIDKDEVIDKKIPLKPIALFKNPTLIGLNNIGSTCFKNSILQCLSQTEDLTNYFLKENSKNTIFNNNIAKKDKNALQLCPVYYDLIKNLWSKNGPKSYSPNHFMKVVEEMSKNDILKFKEGEAGDAKDFIIFILEEFHRELQKSIKNKIPIKQNEPFNQYNQESALNYFFNQLTENCSIISDTFFGFNETTTICSFCKNHFNKMGQKVPICYNYGIFNCLIFPLDEVRKMKNNYMKNNNIHISQNDRVNLYECFFYNEKPEYFTGMNRNFCNICKNTCDATYETKIFLSPNVLILILNRGKGNMYDIKIDFEETIDITGFVIKKDIPKIIYNLYGVITHIGKSGPNAHFVASCKSPVDNKWYRYNDSNVSPIRNVQKEIIYYGTPYILFYKKCYNQNFSKNKK